MAGNESGGASVLPGCVFFSVAYLINFPFTFTFFSWKFRMSDLSTSPFSASMSMLVGTFDVEERVALQGDVAHRHLIGIRLWHLFLSFQVEKLCPRAYQDTTFGVAFHVFYRDVVVMLRSVGTHFQPQDAAGLRDGATAQDDVVVVDGLAAASQSAVAESVRAVLDDDVAVSAVVRILVGRWCRHLRPPRRYSELLREQPGRRCAGPAVLRCCSGRGVWSRRAS